MYQLCKLGISDTILCITISVIIILHITHSFCAIVKFRHSDGAGMYVARNGLVVLYVSGRDAQGRFFVYARILSRKGLEPGLVMG